MNGSRLGYATRESSDDEAYDDQEDIGDVLRGVGGSLLNVVDPLGVRNIFMGPPQRAPLPQMQPAPPPGGVSQLTVATPRGNATVNLPDKVITEDQFRQTTQTLQEAINRDTTRLNTIQGDIQSLNQRIGALVTSSSQDIAKIRRDQREAIERLRRQQASQSSNNMMIGMMTQQQFQRELEDHTHEASGAAKVDDSGTMSFLPFLFMGQDGLSGGDNSMMMMAMAFMFMRRPSS